jgi:GNAT superfamily N-acetyltransferase
MSRDPVLVAVERGGIDGVRQAVEWAAAEGWNPGLLDADCFLEADPEGFLVGRVNGATVATISAVAYGSHFGFVGLYIVEPTLRGHGVGTRLWDAAMERLDGRVIGLDGVAAMQDAYARSGFALAHRNVRYGGRGARRDGDRDMASEPSTVDLDELCAYDEECFGAPRRDFLTAWIAQASGVARVVRRAGRIVGYGVVRRCRDGAKIGPLFADGPDVAEQLVSALLSHTSPDDNVFLDVPEPHALGRELAEGRGLAPVFETARMYRGGAHQIPLDRVYGITSFELG